MLRSAPDAQKPSGSTPPPLGPDCHGGSRGPHGSHLGGERVLVDFPVDQGRADEADEAPHRGAREAQDGLHCGQDAG